MRSPNELAGGLPELNQGDVLSADVEQMLVFEEVEERLIGGTCTSSSCYCTSTTCCS